MISIYISSNINFDHLDKVVSARFLHCKITIVPFTVNKYYAEIQLQW